MGKGWYQEFNFGHERFEMPVSQTFKGREGRQLERLVSGV